MRSCFHDIWIISLESWQYPCTFNYLNWRSEQVGSTESSCVDRMVLSVIKGNSHISRLFQGQTQVTGRIDTWLSHYMETPSASLAPCEDLLHKRSIMRSFNHSSVVSMNYLLNKQPSCRWFETCRSCDVTIMMWRWVTCIAYNIGPYTTPNHPQIWYIRVPL